LTSAGLPAHWQRLDAFEGEGHVRVVVRARLAGGSTVDAWVYALAGTARKD